MNTKAGLAAKVKSVSRYDKSLPVSRAPIYLQCRKKMKYKLKQQQRREPRNANTRSRPHIPPSRIFNFQSSVTSETYKNKNGLSTTSTKSYYSTPADLQTSVAEIKKHQHDTRAEITLQDNEQKMHQTRIFNFKKTKATLRIPIQMLPIQLHSRHQYFQPFETKHCPRSPT